MFKTTELMGIGMLQILLALVTMTALSVAVACDDVEDECFTDACICERVSQEDCLALLD